MYTYLVTIFLEDTDAGGIVYHSKYLNFMERSRTDFFYHKGINHAQLIASQTGHFVVSRADVVYKKPARLGDQLAITVHVVEQRGASIIIEHRIMRNDDLIAQGTITLAYISPHTGAPCRIPDTFKQHLVP